MCASTVKTSCMTIKVIVSYIWIIQTIFLCICIGKGKSFQSSFVLLGCRTTTDKCCPGGWPNEWNIYRPFLVGGGIQKSWVQTLVELDH